MGFHLGLREGDGDLYWCALLLFFLVAGSPCSPGF